MVRADLFSSLAFFFFSLHLVWIITMNVLWIPTSEWADMSFTEQVNLNGIWNEERIVFHCYIYILAGEVSVKVGSKKYC